MQTKKKVWIFHHYATPPSMGGLTRPFDFAKNFDSEKFTFTIFSSSHLHYSGINIIKEGNTYYKEVLESEIPFIFVKTTNYNKSKVLRLKNMIDFYKNLFKVTSYYAKEKGEPDVIIASSAHPLTVIAGQKIAKKFKVPSICEVRDLWPESFVAYDIIDYKNPLLKFLYMGEKWMYKNSDKIIFTMEGGKDYIIDKKWNKENNGPIDVDNVYHINNGVDLEFLNTIKKITL
ncbi:glycosyltransferase [Sinobaca sp. H24]|uniref:glycosyltransferase n=1 Tax=Sinobaca sp. H24 TaxID=2923376 RepID=UPI00207A880D|nr:glycosyltransferase [Sinobaca sp. H24]